MSSPRVEFRKHQDFAGILDGKGIVAAGIGPRQDAILLLVDPAYQNLALGRDKPGEPESAHTLAERPYPATVVRVDGSSCWSVDLQEVDAVYPYIQPLGKDRTLIVSPRCDYREGDPELNATVYEESGAAVHKMVFGDGIRDVQVTRDERIWVSYFDEGVFGNYGWSSPMGSDGILCFSSEGEITYRFRAPARFDSVADCYAMNVTRETVWACYYTGFPLVRISSDDSVRGWANTSAAGVRALAVCNDRVLLWGGYGDKKHQCVVLTMAKGRLASPQVVDLQLPSVESLDGAQVVGRGPILHAIVGSVWYQYDLRELERPTPFWAALGPFPRRRECQEGGK